ncbi:MAG TPA: amidohydrolase [Desulfobacterales bacterium]|nr:amidohydrolase [Desulfobacterales bacterium]
MNTTPCDILITNIKILPAAGEKIIEDGFLATRGGTIKLMGPMASMPAALSAAKTIEGHGQLVMPGLINGHCHAAMTLFRGLADDLPLMTWLNDHIFPAEAASVNSEMVYCCSQLAAAEMILSGTTTVGDGYFLEEAAARAFCTAGLRAVAAQGIIDFPAPGVPDPSLSIEAARRYLNALPTNDLLIPALFCHSPYTCSPATLLSARELAAEYNCRLFIHVSETKNEVLEHQKLHGLRPIEHLRKLGFLAENTVCVHCVWPDSSEIAILADSGCGVITCPESNMKLGSGIAPVPAMLAAGIKTGLGTDGCASNNDLNMWGEMDSLAKIHKAVTLDPTIMPAPVVLDMATRGGAAALGLNLGTLRPGMAADMIIIDLQQPHLTPFYGPDLLIYALRGAEVRHSIIGGKLVMENRQLLNIDIKAVMAAVNRLAELHNQPLGEGDNGENDFGQDAGIKKH